MLMSQNAAPTEEEKAGLLSQGESAAPVAEQKRSSSSENAESVHELALRYLQEGNIKEAIVNLKYALTLQKKQYGEKSREVAQSLFILGMLLRGVNLAEAEHFLSECLKMRTELLRT